MDRGHHEWIQTMSWISWLFRQREAGPEQVLPPPHPEEAYALYLRAYANAAYGPCGKGGPRYCRLREDTPVVGHLDAHLAVVLGTAHGVQDRRTRTGMPQSFGDVMEAIRRLGPREERRPALTPPGASAPSQQAGEVA